MNYPDNNSLRMESQKPGFLEKLWVKTKYFRKKTRFLWLGA